MAQINFNIPDSNFAEVVKRKAQSLKDNSLFYYNIFEMATIEFHSEEEIWRDLLNQLKPIKDKTDRMVFISELLIHLGEARETIINELNGEERTLALTDDLVHFLFRELEKLKVGVDKNAFSNSEINDLTKKIKSIIQKLEEVKVGQEVIFDRVEELKEDYKDILNSFGLGKKPFFQRFAGIFANYVGEKGADEAFELLKPIIKKVVDNIKQISL